MSIEFAGVDISAKTLEACASRHGEAVRTFPNTPAGRRELAAWLRPKTGACRVVLEPTGIYSLDVALALHGAPGLEVMVANPRRTSNFARVRGQRGKTDAMDARTLRAFAQSLPFVAWARPSDQALELRQLVRHIDALVRHRARTKNQLHAAKATKVTPRALLDDLDEALVAIEARIDRLRKAALDLVSADPKLTANYALLRTIPGVAEVTALNLIGELTLLPADMTARQWVAHAGLDPRPFNSGTSVRGRTRLSRQGNRYLRHSLYLPALAASRHNPHVAAFRARLEGRGKAKKEAVVAVMRKLLHAIHGMLHSGTAWDSARFCGGTG